MSGINPERDKILLGLLPFWTPLTPPLGITCLKSFLQIHGYTVVAKDASAEREHKDFSDRYFNLLKGFIPESNRGNFYSIVHQVLRSHLMAHINNHANSTHEPPHENQYLELVKTLVYTTFYHHLETQQVQQLIELVDLFYAHLETYLIELLEAEKPALFGLTVYSDTLAPSVFAFRLVRQRYPQIKTVMGGGVFADHLAPGSPNFEYFSSQTIDYIDHIVIGEGEHVFLELLQGQLNPEQRIFSLKDIGSKTLDITTAPLPDLSGFDLEKYPYLVSYTSRSCPFQCNFCSETVQWGNYRKKSPDQIHRELTALHQAHGNQLFLLGDSLLNPVITGLAEAFLQSSTVLYWEGWLRAEKPVCDIDNTLLWRRGGFYHARIGAESGSPRILEMMQKKITPQQIKDAIIALAYAGIKTSTLWIIGYPGETEEDFQHTLNLIEELKYDIYEAEGTPFWYYLTGQPNSDRWQQKYTHRPLYPESAQQMLMGQSWALECQPDRQETFQRLARFIQHLEKLGIPNTYSLLDIHNADQRWKNLQKNAVPAFLEFQTKQENKQETKQQDKQDITECRNIKKLAKIEPVVMNEAGFGF